MYVDENGNIRNWLGRIVLNVNKKKLVFDDIKKEETKKIMEEYPVSIEGWLG